MNDMMRKAWYEQSLYKQKPAWIRFLREWLGGELFTREFMFKTAPFYTGLFLSFFGMYVVLESPTVGLYAMCIGVVAIMASATVSQKPL